MFKVKATMRGLYKHQRIEPGKVFMIVNVKEFSHVWMKSLDTKLDAALKGVQPKKPTSKAIKNAVEVLKPAPSIEPKVLTDAIDDIDESHLEENEEIEPIDDISSDEEISDDVI